MSSLIKTHSRSTTRTDRHECPTLISYLDLLYPEREVKALEESISSSIDHQDIHSVLEIYNESIKRLEKHIWSSEKNNELLKIYQSLFHEIEHLHQLIKTESRHDFIIVIPVADRPVQLTNCIDSLIKQCETYQYGGTAGGRYTRLSVIIADDSIDAGCRKSIARLAQSTTRKGIKTIYFGRSEQQLLVEELDDDSKSKFQRVTGQSLQISRDTHLGPSTMRNLCYLYLDRNIKPGDQAIYYFIDSDQLFTVDPVRTDRHALNYFYHLDKLFTEQDIQVVTGKVVGDPPVSPAVMANTLLDDTIHLIDSMLKVDAEANCEFHRHQDNELDQASYHDMANLFGFGKQSSVFEYECPLEGDHTNQDCLVNFSQALIQFFHGEHPTRATHFHYSYPQDSIEPARTVYTGNFAFTHEALSWFIPFSGLKLRMAGPTLGRILKSSLGNRFASVNLPMLHKRTLSETGMAEFRAGVNHDDSSIDLGQEFKRQYFGDVMLFSIEELCNSGFPQQTADTSTLRKTVLSVEQSMNKRYNDKQKLLLAKLDLLQSYLEQLDHHPVYGTNAIKQNMKQFISNIQLNYGNRSNSFNVINDKATKHSILESIIESIQQYPDLLDRWKDILTEKP